MKTSIQIINSLNLKIIIINNKYYFSFLDSYYCLIPNYVKFFIVDNCIDFHCEKVLFEKEFIKFIRLFKVCVKRSQKPFVKKLILRGLGLKANLSPNGDCLELKLGFSHLIKVKIPKSQLSIKLYKHTIVVFGVNIVTIKNFMAKIRNFKSPNTYKGKGIWYKNENRVLKPVKKN